LLLLCFRARRMYDFWLALLGAAAAWLAVNLPIYLLYRDAWLTFFRNNRNRPADPDSLWHVLEAVRDASLDRVVSPGGAPTVLNIAVAVGMLAVGLGVGALALGARRRPRLPQLLFLLVAGFLLTNKVWSPQYSLWLVPLAVLARPSWRALLAWQAFEAFLWFPRLYWYLGVGNKGLDESWFLLAVMARDVAVLWLVALVVRDILRPEYDVVRSAGADDPAGGVLDGAPDRSDGWPDGSDAAAGWPPGTAGADPAGEVLDWRSAGRPGGPGEGRMASEADRNTT
jgi:uncharacterized membrane protein